MRMHSKAQARHLALGSLWLRLVSVPVLSRLHLGYCFTPAASADLVLDAGFVEHLRAQESSCVEYTQVLRDLQLSFGNRNTHKFHPAYSVTSVALYTPVEEQLRIRSARSRD